jgi:chlorobactene glucosyltransferase
MLTPLVLYQAIVVLVLLALLDILLVNLAVLPRFARYSFGEREPPSVAVLVPARNEEANIEACLRSLLSEDYPDYQVWLYDDVSSDATGSIAARVASEDKRLRVLTGTEGPPPGWLGKANACHRLYLAMRAEANPDYVLFTDVDVRFSPEAVSHAVATAEATSAGLLSVYPKQITKTWAERLAVPFLLHWTVHTFLPLPLAFSQHAPSAFAAANGQFMLFTREAYEACGGHATVRSTVLEDVALARAVKRSGYRAMLADCGPFVQVRMYAGLGDVWQGFSKNVFAFFGHSPFFLLLGIAGLVALYVVPPLLALFLAFRGDFGILFYLSVLAYILAVLGRLAIALRFGYRPLDALLHPVAVLLVIAIALNSMRWWLRGKGEWKGRVVGHR